MSSKESHLQGGVDRRGDPTLTSEVFHAMHIILSLKLGVHEALALFIHGQLLKRTLLYCSACDPDPDPNLWIPESRSCLLVRPVQDFLVLPGCCWWDASTPASNSGKLCVGLYLLFYFSYCSYY